MGEQPERRPSHANRRTYPPTFRSLDAAVGHTRSYRLTTIGWAPATLATLAGVTMLAIILGEEGAHWLPELFSPLKRWLNVWLQIFVNPLALLSFIGLGVAIVKTGVVWPWVGWTMVVWSVPWLFFPVPLLIAPVPVFLGIALLVHG